MSLRPSSEVIRAAYRSLSTKYHPDRNIDGVGNARIMQIINASYAVLSDREKRSKHDEWIVSAETKSHTDNARDNGPSSESARSRTEQKSADPVRKSNKRGTVFGKVLWGTLIAAIGGFWIYSANKAPEASGLPPYQPTQQNDWKLDPPSEGEDARRETLQPTTDESAINANVQVPSPSNYGSSQAPNGQLWPTSAGYVKGYPVLRQAGHNKVTIDNSRNSDDVFVKLILITKNKTTPVRQTFIPKYGSFEMSSLSPGQYDVRYLNISDGTLFRTEQFQLKHSVDEKGVYFNTITMTLFKVPQGNMQTFSLSSSEF